jgi:Na+-driven multidrug efflux pump
MLTFNLRMAPFVTKAAVLGSLLNIFLNYLFIKVMDFGIVGASGASSLSYTLVAISIGLKARRLSK